MPHQCVRCGTFYQDGSSQILSGCDCGGRFFFFIRQERMEKLKEAQQNLSEVEIIQIEQDVREMIGIPQKAEIPVILDLESIRVLKPGKFEIDVVNLFSRKRPLIYKLEEGKYIIDLASTLKVSAEELKKINHTEEK